MLILFFIPIVLVLIELSLFVKNGKRTKPIWGQLVVDIIGMIPLPILFLMVLDYGQTNDCCGDSAFFSPKHRLSMYVCIGLCLFAFFLVRYSNVLFPPLIELFLNVLLVLGIVLNGLIAVQWEAEPLLFWILGSMPVIILTAIALSEQQQKILAYLSAPNDMPNRLAWWILRLQPFLKYPLLLILCLPVLVILSSILLIFGQKPDSFIRAFTDTYKHGFSQLNHECANVKCGGHFLCSVAANGHQNVVKPQRLGVRAGKTIVCNRQLLIANAFEEVLEEYLPTLHAFIRHRYNLVGKVIHKYYGIFGNKYLSDTIYFLMKPAEWFFLLVLYCVDKKPENRIAKQYLSQSDRQALVNNTEN